MSNEAVWTTFHIPGLDCPGEMPLVQRAVGTLQGVDQVEPDYLARRLRVRFSPQQVTAERIAAALTDVGMDAREILPIANDAVVGRLPLPKHIFVGGGVLLAAAALLAFESPLAAWTSVALAIASTAVAGFYVMRAAVRAVRYLTLDMNVLMTVAALGAIGIGEYFEAATAMVLFGLSLWLESLSVARARLAVASLLPYTTTACHRLTRDGATTQIVDIPADQVVVGDELMIRPGERLPVDGTVVEGSSVVDQSAITGESLPIEKQAGDEVFAGSLNGDGAITIHAARAAADSTIAQMGRLVEQARLSRSPTERFVDSFARRYTPAVIVAAILMVVVPLGASYLGYAWAEQYAATEWLRRALVLLVIACPCALVISTPVTIVSALYRAARSGILVKGGEHLENAARIDAVAFDKTGTLTTGKLEVATLEPFGQLTEPRLLEIVAALEHASEHPLARAVVRAAEQQGVAIPEASEFASQRGLGVAGVVQGKKFFVGSTRYMASLGRTLPAASGGASATASPLTAVWLADETSVLGVIRLADQVRPHASEAVAALKELGASEIYLLTGDQAAAASVVGERLGITQVRAELLPQDKISAVQAIAASGKQLAMIGDGVNDGPALAAARVGIALGGQASDLALETADVVMVNPDVRSVPTLIAIARRCRRLLWQNIALSLGTKAAILVLAVDGAASMWMAVLADVGASLLVIANGMRILSFAPAWEQVATPEPSVHAHSATCRHAHA